MFNGGIGEVIEKDFGWVLPILPPVIDGGVGLLIEKDFGYVEGYRD